MNRNAETVRESGFYSSKKWLSLRNAIRERDMMTCQKCGDYQAERYEVDHITELNWQNVDDWEVAYNPDNLQLLCHECHVRKTREYRKNGKRLFY
ncbi:MULTISPECIES: HNH endonuclease [unclassified Lactococcus]|uniref:HNH endonuclease n=1 Tax=unclassified Lactococcus TaxID=2643510 RepID=UPI0011CBD7DF|nr:MULTISPECIES: HNH endonuclease signature motif containing protein [unclassified Lactococcus]MQW21990.1 HNH endonuclease [Lactococcus sp. dk101]TXK36829.1 HNH endonuclease [Lactococcus sp. dk310]TXK47473.1 HNH endonuclease [Lactococcus sp. dk322]